MRGVEESLGILGMKNNGFRGRRRRLYWSSREFGEVS